jgi:hypothetical protein
MASRNATFTWPPTSALQPHWIEADPPTPRQGTPITPWVSSTIENLGTQVPGSFADLIPRRRLKEERISDSVTVGSVEMAESTDSSIFLIQDF